MTVGQSRIHSGFPGRVHLKPNETAYELRKTTSRRSLLAALGVGAIGISFGLDGCSKPGAAPGGSSASGAAEEPKLNFYNWDEYIGDTTLDDFKTATGIDVNMSLSPRTTNCSPS